MRLELEKVGGSQKTRSQRLRVRRWSLIQRTTSACTYSCSGPEKPLRSMLRSAQSR